MALQCQAARWWAATPQGRERVGTPVSASQVVGCYTSGQGERLKVARLNTVRRACSGRGVVPESVTLLLCVLTFIVVE